MAYCVYILYRESAGRYYEGQTQDISKRILRHNKGQVQSTKHGIPWRIEWTIELSSRSDSMILERKVKKRGIKRYLLDIGM